MLGEPASCQKLKRYKTTQRHSKGFWLGWYKSATHSVEQELIDKKAPCVDWMGARRKRR